MAVRHHVDGAIAVDPPITADEIAEHAVGKHGPGPRLVLDKEGHSAQIRYESAPGAYPGDWHGGDDELAAELQEIVDAYRTAPDGTPRTFTGWLDCVAYLDDEGESPYRIAVAAGQASIYEPMPLWWPAAVSDGPPPLMSVAVADTPHFSFIATGATPEAARAALLAGWKVHARQTGADPNYLNDSINVVTGPIGQAWRDYSPMLKEG